MQRLTSTIALKEAILELEMKQAEQGNKLRETFILAWDSLKPASIVKNMFTELVESNGIVSNVLGSTLGLTAGFVSKKLFLGSSVSQLRKIFGSIIQLGAALVMAEKPAFIQSFLNLFFKSIFGGKKSIR